MRRRALHRLLAVAAVLGGVLAPLVGGRVTAAHGEERISPVELATWIRDRKAGLRVLDLRPPVEAELLHLPRAERIPAESLGAARFRTDETIVLVSADGGGPAPRVWASLRARGNRRVVVMDGGADRWVDDILGPTLAADAPPEVVAAFHRVSELSRYFGGVPRVLGPGEAPARPQDGAARHAVVRGRGC